MCARTRAQCAEASLTDDVLYFRKVLIASLMCSYNKSDWMELSRMAEVRAVPSAHRHQCLLVCSYSFEIKSCREA